MPNKSIREIITEIWGGYLRDVLRLWRLALRMTAHDLLVYGHISGKMYDRVRWL